MVALLKSSVVSSSSSSVAPKNIVRSSKKREAFVEGRKGAPRVRVTLAAWVCGESSSQRGYALEMNAGGARFGGMGLKLKPGEPVIVKLVVDAREAPIVIKGEVARYAPSASACPELCVKFVDVPLDEHVRLSACLRR